VIDVYYKLFWLKKKGIRIHLHCFEYGRPHAEQLENLCESVTYYPRATGITSHITLLPYTVKSRQSNDLEKNLQKNDFPILFEVLHTCYLLDDPKFKDRIKIYRHSNIEHEYYKHLAHSERSQIKKYYLLKEAAALEKFEKIVDHANIIMAVNEHDAKYYREKYREPKVVYLPSFHMNERVVIPQGRGNYVLYNGNLSVGENNEAAIWLVDNVFAKLEFQVIIAGLNPSEELMNKIAQHNHIDLAENPTDAEMTELIHNAHVHCLYTAQATGLKLKLLNVLFGGRFIVCNQNMLEGTGLHANKGLLVTKKYIEEVKRCFDKDFNDTLIEERKSILDKFSNSTNADLLIKTIWND
jgi:hypothetical protein